MKGNMISPKGAIFDQDGLLFDTEVIFEQAWIKAGKELGLPIDLALTHRLSGCGKKELADIVGEDFPGSDSGAIVELAHCFAAETQLTSYSEDSPPKSIATVFFIKALLNQRIKTL